MANELPEDRPNCEHYWADHCWDGLSVRLCQLCHEPDWVDMRRQWAEVAAAERERCAFLLRSLFPPDFLKRHGLHPRASTRDILDAAAAEIEGK